MFPVLFNDGEDSCRDYTMCATEVVVDFCTRQSRWWGIGGLFTLQCECDRLLKLLQFFGQREIALRSYTLSRHNYSLFRICNVIWWC